MSLLLPLFIILRTLSEGKVLGSGVVGGQQVLPGDPRSKQVLLTPDCASQGQARLC